MASAWPLLLRLFAALLAAAHLTGATLVAKNSTSKVPAQLQRMVPGQMTWWQEVTNESMLPKNLSQLGEAGYEVLASEGSLPQFGEAGYEAFSSRARTPASSTQTHTREASTTEVVSSSARTSASTTQAVTSSTRTSASTAQAVSSSARTSASTTQAVSSSERTSASTTQAPTRQASTTEVAEEAADAAVSVAAAEPAASSTTAASSSEGRANFTAAAKASAVLAENNATATDTKISTTEMSSTSSITATDKKISTTAMSSTSSITATDTKISTTETQTSTATLTSTTASGTQTTTSTTTEYCFTEEISWEPLDMHGTVSSEEVDARACQARCQRTAGCHHFSYWKAGGYCHLQDVLALRKSDRIGFLSGPFQCWSYINNPMLIRQSKDVFIPKQFECMEIGVTYAPAITTPAHLEGSVSEMVSAGQRLCQLTNGCSHFSLEVSSRQYWLSGPDATPLPEVLNAISGPPVCSSDQASIFMQKKFSGGDESRNAAPRPSSAGGAAARLASTIIIASFAVGLLVAGSVPLGIHFWRRSTRVRAIPRDRADPGDEASAAQLLDEEHADDGDDGME